MGGRRIMDVEVAAAVAQFGSAGLIGWMWLTERRAAGERDRQVAELHERIMQERECVTACLDALKDNTRAITALEGTQRVLAEAVGKLGVPRAKAPAMSGKKGEAA
jgi:hypothetical protein